MIKKKTIQDSGKNVTEQVTQNINKILEEKFFALEEKHEKLKETVHNQDKRIYFLEKQTRQKNVVFFGIEELESSYDTLEKNMLEWIEQHFSVELSYSDLQEVKRLGKKGDRPRPVVVTFLTLGIKIKIFKQKRGLRDTNYYMKEDCPKHVLEKRNQLQEQLKAEREKGNTAFLKYDKLVVHKQTSKRKFSPSPIKPKENMPKERNTQTNKKNKSQQQNPSARRSNSISEGVIKPSMLNFLTNKNTEINQETSKNNA
ncbi:hypothetical protein EVAR_80457_1 [Eumeta japonica]|uniref:Endonuclease-reverse transcriptase n=1 Tax=Eumeta variegata TaxID=151549 RepID=A0A4C1VI43_EUMVA|nr:hypothetical protein EVAR_80457_1 [Eumeta japonica]